MNISDCRSPFLAILPRIHVRRGRAIYSQRVRGIVTGLACLLFLPLFSTTAAQEAPEYRSGLVVVQFDSVPEMSGNFKRTGLEGFDRAASRYDVHRMERVYPFLDHVMPTPKIRRNLLAFRRTYYVHYHAKSAPTTVAGSLSRVQGVVYAEPVPVHRTHAAGQMQRVDPNDPKYGVQSELRLLRLPEAWDEVKGGEGNPKVVIAIVDGGGEWRHEDLRANVWINHDEIPSNKIDDDNNGFIDDVHGVNFTNEDSTNNDPTWRRGLFGRPQHGTATSGAASAVSDNNVGIAGASWNALLMHVNATDPLGFGITYGYEGILYAAMNGASVISTSWGSLVPDLERSRFLDESLDLVTDMGALVVASVGNSGMNIDIFRTYPASHPRVLSVGATEKNTVRLASFSNYGKLVDVFSPGESIITTGVENEYIQVNGTSFSAPLVAGVAALVKTKFPDMTPDALREKIRFSAESIDSENPDFEEKLGRGIVNALAAVREARVPALRLKRWSWEDDDGDHAIASGDVVRIRALFFNHLADAARLTAGITVQEPYSFLDLRRSEADIGFLAGGDSVEVTFEFSVNADAPLNQQIHLYTHVQAEQMEDMADMLSFRINRSLQAVHQSLNVLYTATGGDQWHRKDNWNFKTVPTEKEFGQWYGISMKEGWLRELRLSSNNLMQSIPAELGELSELHVLNLSGNLLSGSLPVEITNLSELRRLDLSSNSLSGSILSGFEALHKLEQLRLFNNSFSGIIPASLGNLVSLKTLDLERNSLSGSIPPELGNLSRLLWLGLRENSLSGSIPPELGNLFRLSAIDLGENDLSGSIPAEFGNLLALEWLVLRENSLSGVIPPELGNLSKLTLIDLAYNALSDSLPSELGNLPRLNALDISYNSLTGSLPRSLTQLENLQELHFEGQSLCAPKDAEFQTWLTGILDVTGRTCGEFGFAGGIRDQNYPVGQPVPTLVLPQAIDGTAPVQYTLTPDLPAGLRFDPLTRTLRGTPTVVTASAINYTYKAVDAAGNSSSLRFMISIHSPVSRQNESLPEAFVVQGNYPNPFQKFTRLTFDLPWQAHVQVEVMDVLGRRVLSISGDMMSPGWAKSIQVHGGALSPGVYLYRLIADSTPGRFVQTGSFVRTQ